MMIAALFTLMALGAEPIHLHPVNPHYFEFRGKPTILVTSGEHYGAVLNLDFDHAPYLNELKSRGFNLTRTFSGVYFEARGDFKIHNNTLAPDPSRYIGPWLKRGEKFDLDAWNDAYFHRLKGFVSEAAGRGIVVEYVLFCPFYEESMWALSPQNSKNNVNGVGSCPRTEVYTLKHPDLLRKQLAFVKKAVDELKDFDNVYFEVCNEPYFGGATGEWQTKVIEMIIESEESLSSKHMIARNIANGSPKIVNPHPAVSLFNLHYATGLGENYAIGKAIGDDETGFKGTSDRVYRAEAWDFLLDGGAVFNNLDYSYTTDHEDGLATVSDPTPGGGGPKLRSQLAILKTFLDDLNFLRMSPVRSVLPEASLDPAIKGLAQPGLAYAFYKNGGGKMEIAIDVPLRTYRVEWIEPRTGKVIKAEKVDLRSKRDRVEPSPAQVKEGKVDKSHSARLALTSPAFDEDLAVRVIAEPNNSAEVPPK
jgi:hypothetical protein